MNTYNDSTGSAPTPALSRRGFLGVMTMAAIPATDVVVEAKAEEFDWNRFFADAIPAEIARFHANALTEIMAEMHPELSWRHVVDHKTRFVLVVGDSRPASVAEQEV